MKRIKFLFLLLFLLKISTVFSLCYDISFSERISIGEQPLQNDKVYFISQVDKEPSFPGGNSQIYPFLQQHLKTRKLCEKKTDKVGGTVDVKFVVEKNGTITNVVIEGSDDKSYDTEVLNAISKMPIWTPGEKSGQKVAVEFHLGVLFKDNNPNGK